MVALLFLVSNCSVFQKTYSYVQRFSGTKDPVTNQASVTELREYVLLLMFLSVWIGVVLNK